MRLAPIPDGLREVVGGLVGVGLGLALVVSGEGWGWAIVVACGLPLAVIGVCDLILLAASLPSRLRVRAAERRVAQLERELADMRAGAARAKERLSAFESEEPGDR